jgi:hypothetical protein
MAARIQIEDLKKIIETKRVDEEIQPMIDAAHLVVDEDLANSGYTEDRKKLIELWLAAHYVAVRDPLISSVSGGPGSAGTSTQYDGKTGMVGLEHTRYGLQVIAFDKLGILSRESRSKGKISFEAYP